MKSKYVILASAVLISVSTFAQKDEIKSADKAFKKGNSAESVSILVQAESIMGNATDDEKAQYYSLKGNAYLDLATKNVDASANLMKSANAYIELINIEKKSGKTKYTLAAQNSINDLIGKLIDSAVQDSNKKDYKLATEKLYATYELNPKDLEKLYYAANFAINDKDYDTALKYYEILKVENYTGEGTGYYATSLVHGKEEFFGNTPESKKDRDDKVKLKLYSNPRDEKIESKKGEIYRNIALILVSQGKVDEAKKALADAVAANPDDSELKLEQANLYLKLEDFATYKKIVNEVLAKNPNDANLVFNLGVIASKTDPAEAETYYKKAIEIDPNYVNAYLNLSVLILEKEKPLIDEMNKLGTSAADNKKYDALKKERDEVFLKAMPYLEKANQLDPKNADVASTLMNVYSALEMSDKKKALKAKMNN